MVAAERTAAGMTARATHSSDAGYRRGSARLAVLELLDSQPCARLRDRDRGRAPPPPARRSNRLARQHLPDPRRARGARPRRETRRRPGHRFASKRCARAAATTTTSICDHCGTLTPFTDAELERTIRHVSRTRRARRLRARGRSPRRLHRLRLLTGPARPRTTGAWTAPGARALVGLAVAVAAVLFGSSPSAGAGGISGRAVAPGRFQPGSCVSFAPTAGDRHRTVFIDAGHGGPDPGAVGVTTAGKTVHEAVLTLRVALDTLPLLRAAGYRVVLSRTGAAAVARPVSGDLSGGAFTGQGVHRDLIARDLCANRANANVLLGVYFNASESAAAAGSLTLYDATRPFWPASLRLAELVQRAVLARLNVARRNDPRRRRPHGRRVRLVRHERRPGVRPPADPRPGEGGLLLDPEPDARRADRAALHHRSLRGIDR